MGMSGKLLSLVAFSYLISIPAIGSMIYESHLAPLPRYMRTEYTLGGK